MFEDETGFEAWMRNCPLPCNIRQKYKPYTQLCALSSNPGEVFHTTITELQTGLQNLLACHLNVSSSLPNSGEVAIVIATVADYEKVTGSRIDAAQHLNKDGFMYEENASTTLILGQNENGILYGAFELLMMIGRWQEISNSLVVNQSSPNRFVNQWDNMDGTIERGYGGKSMFFADGKIHDNLTRVRQYARLLSSIRLNGIFINNVNSSSSLLTPDNLQGVAKIAGIMRSYGIKVGLALFFDSPKELGGLPTSDPLDPAVIEWWTKKSAEIHHFVPDLLGFLIKANSEGQPGPLTYGRSLADGANLFARALRPFGHGQVFYRAFVYDHHLDESNWKNDRANAAVEFFQHLDDDFDDNVVVQVKFGPIDFQVREPPSPLLAAMRRTNVMIEFMVCQEYLGQQSHLVYQAPLWKTILDFDMRVDNIPTPVHEILSGKRFGWSQTGFAAVVNAGVNDTWLGSHTAMANLFAYGRLACDPSLDPRSIVEDWSCLTFGNDEGIVRTVSDIAMDSWPAYENYSGNLGIQTLCDIIGIHFGPGPSSQDGNGWGQWTRANVHTIGMDRTAKSGSSNTQQYPQEVARMFEDLQTCPDELLLWFHHVPYTHRLRSGKTVIQHFYDAHYTGAAEAQTFPLRWRKLENLIDGARYRHVLRRLVYQAGHAIVWRDAICEFYRTKCGIPDEHGRVGCHPNRIAAHTMVLDGYEPFKLEKPEMAPDGTAVIIAAGRNSGTVSTVLQHPPGIYDVAVNYYDQSGGKAKYELYIDHKMVATWNGDLEDDLGHDFSPFVDGQSATRIVFPGLCIGEKSTLKIIGHADGTERAALSYISILQPGKTD